MFGLGKRERAAEALRRGTAAALTGGFLHHSQIETLGLSKEASAWIYMESIVHQLFALGVIYSNCSISDQPWATAKFFNDTVSDALTQHERNNQLSPGTMTSFIFKRIDDFARIDRPSWLLGSTFLILRPKRAQDPNTDKKHRAIAYVVIMDSLLDDAENAVSIRDSR
ncbi:MAG: hypothetical protein IPH26_13020 [Sterolibacteriaceae bacterium]|uniref:Uncharacterized protein n=1 Tax=Candidatus Methylophosphatis roskildensis TaxID=2899263 RepID=A0A9D7DZJ0_9PROT|nr:hypothetical protein [Candidatus Methylophosphatis roskildensis]MBK7237950.1 hypothetical protein [Sterolibacteriaceae bacterium]